MEAKKKKIIAHFLIIAFFIVAIIGLVLTQTQIAYAEDKASSGLPIEGDLIFSLYTTADGSQEYSVSAFNNELAEAIIPETFNGITVSEVADNAFSNCKNLTYALVPLSIKRVGNNAFSNCTQLKTIHGLTNVEIFGNFVFYNCTILNNLILPGSVEKLGTNVIKNVPNRIYSRKSSEEMSALNAAWTDDYSNILFGNVVVCEDVTINGVNGFKITPYNNFEWVEDFTIYSYATYKDVNGSTKTLPILEISDHAFAGSIFKTLTIQNAKPEDDHLINLRSNAFYGLKAESLSINVGITLNDDSVENNEIGISNNIFATSIISEITLPTNVEFNRFSRSMFAKSSISTLKYTDKTLDNHIPNNIQRIDSNAFDKVYTLQEINIPSSVISMGQNVFNFWGIFQQFDKYIINIDFDKIPAGWHSGWLGTINENNVTVNYTQAKDSFDITLDMDGGTGGSNVVHAEYGKPMPSAIAPTKNNYIFMGYFTGKNGTGVKYYNADMTSAQNWNTQSNGTLYAYWKGVESVIKFDKMGGINGHNEISAEYGKPMPTAVAPSKTNYVFQGYYTDKNGKGTKYYDANMNSVHDWDKAIDTTLYAHWLGTPSIIKFDQQGGMGGSADAVAIFGNPMPDSNNYGKLIAPTRQNYIFQGYFESPNGIGEKYYDSNMNSCINWNKATESTLYASWRGVDCKIKFDKTGGTGGTDFITVEYGTKLPQLSINDAPTKKLFTFDGYQYNDTIYYNNKMECNKYWYNAETTIMYATWRGEEFEIKLNGLNNNLSIIVNYSEPLPQNLAIPEKAGYTFDGFYLEGYNKKIYNANMSSAIEVWDIDHAEPLYALWKANTYKIILADNQNQDISAIYNDVMPTLLNFKQKPGYNLIGYSSKPNGGGKQYYKFTYKVWKNQYLLNEQQKLSLCDFDYDITLYPIYEAIEYKITVWMSDDPSQNTLMEYKEFYLNYGDSRIFTVPTYDGYTYVETKRGWRTDAGEVKEYFTNSTSVKIEVFNPYMTMLTYDVVYQKNACVAEGSLITLADGSQVPVEQLTGNELLLVWNLKTGAFDTAPILFIDHDKRMNYEVINLEFSDGTTVKVISEHAFWDFDLNQYVFLRKDAAKYIGHWFNKQIIDDNGNMTWIKVRLTNVEVRNEYTSAWSPVTYGHLCYYVNGMLSMPGATEGLINIFDVDSDTMKFNEISYQDDIEKYGIFTYEEFAELYPVPREIFDAFNAEYLKVSLGKGLITQEQLGRLIKIYSKFFM